MTLKSFQEDPYVAANPESLPFWRAAEEGVLLGKACSDCGKLHWYPRAICPFCGSDHTEWKPLSGRGTVYAFSTLRRAAQPYTVAYVQLEEGATMLTNLVEIDDNDMRIGMPVRVAFRRTDEGRNAPTFTAETAR
ncbi:Zn-ribbon domain-containing OB-fold protein [Cupriavidus sp. Agwp_2]|uniref:Zn-ribbon domain-containing OB-fold protein n=1 Tax=Cupriavidus sp. Agwp_2 TaxID=2897324 RepID=UPI00346066AB